MKLKQTALAIGVALASGLAVTHAQAVDYATLGRDTKDMAIDVVLARAYVTNYADGTLSMVKLPATTPSRTIPVGERPQSVLSDSAHHRIYVAHATPDGHISVLDASNANAIAEIPVGANPASMAADFRRGELYVANRDSNSVSFIDTTTNTVVATVFVGRNPGSIAVDTLAGRIYVVSATDGAVWVLDRLTREPVAIVPVGNRPGNAAVDEGAGKVYVNNIDDRTVAILDAGSNTVRKVVRVGAGSTAGMVSDIYRQYYLPNALDDTVSIIDLDDDEVVATVNVDTAPQSVVVDEVRSKAYVANRGSNTVSVIDPRTAKLTDSIRAGTAPWRTGLASGMLLALNRRAGDADSMTMAALHPEVAETAIATEFHDPTRDTYFNTADALETAALRDGAAGGVWQRTMEFFRVWTGPGEGRSAVCRLYSSDTGAHDAHYFAADPWDCLKQYQKGNFVPEGTAYFVMVPGDSGQCPLATVPLYRLDRDNPGDAHQQRFTSSAAVRNAMTRSGWIATGFGPEFVYACTPALRGD